MQSENGRARRRPAAIALGLVTAMLGWSFAAGGIGVLQKWDVIGAAYAACGIVWVVSGGLMTTCGIWAGLARGSRIVRLVAAGATFAAGATAVAGTATYVIPCAGPS
jgi:hypothetical protein